QFARSASRPKAKLNPRRSEVEKASPGAEVDDRGSSDQGLLAPALVDVPADHQPGPLGLDRLEDGAAAEMAAEGPIHIADGGGMDYQHGAFWTRREQLGGRRIGQV